MATKDEVFAKEIETLRQDVTRLRDEIRVKLHLGAMDARDAFAHVEHEVEHVARDASKTTRHALEKARKQLRVLAEAFRSPTTPANGKPA